MNKQLNRELECYYKNIAAVLLCDKNEKDSFIKELKGNIREYIEDEPDATIEDIKDIFGTEKAIGESFRAEADITSIRKKLSLKKTVISALAAIVFIYLIFVIISFIDVHTEAHGYFTEITVFVCNRFFAGVMI